MAHFPSGSVKCRRQNATPTRSEFIFVLTKQMCFRIFLLQLQIVPIHHMHIFCRTRHVALVTDSYQLHKVNKKRVTMS